MVSSRFGQSLWCSRCCCAGLCGASIARVASRCPRSKKKIVPPLPSARSFVKWPALVFCDGACAQGKLAFSEPFGTTASSSPSVAATFVSGGLRPGSFKLEMGAKPEQSGASSCVGEPATTVLKLANSTTYLYTRKSRHNFYCSSYLKNSKLFIVFIKI
jgi:hypothetical protein